MPTNRPGYLREYYARKRDEIIGALGGRCACCGCTYDLEIHHVNGYTGKGGERGRGSLHRLTDWKRELPRGGLELLCQDCHERLHFGHPVRAAEYRKDEVTA